MRQTYHGWVVIEEASTGFLPRIYVEYTSGDNKRRRKEMNSGGNRGCIEAIEWWDKKLGCSVKLEPTIRGCFRVYTEPCSETERG